MLQGAVVPGSAAAAAGFAAVAAAAQQLTFSQLFQRLGGNTSGSCKSIMEVLWNLAHDTPGWTPDRPVAPVLLRFTSPDLLAGCRLHASAGSAAQRRSITNTLVSLQQLLQHPQLDAVLGTAVRQQRQAYVSLALQEVLAISLQAGSSSSSQSNGTVIGGQDVAQSGASSLPSHVPQAALGQFWGGAAASSKAVQATGTAALPAAVPSTAAALDITTTQTAAAAAIAAAAAANNAGTARDRDCSSSRGGARSAAVPSPAASAAAVAETAAAAASEYEGPAPAGGDSTNHGSISMADLLQQLQSSTGSRITCGGVCIKQMESSVACFGGVSLDAIPASLLLTNYIAGVGERAQQCVSAGVVAHTLRQQGAARALAIAECLVLLQEVEGLLQLSGQPLLQQVLGGQRLQELVVGLLRCKLLLGVKLRSLNVLCP